MKLTELLWQNSSGSKRADAGRDGSKLTNSCGLSTNHSHSEAWIVAGRIEGWIARRKRLH